GGEGVRVRSADRDEQVAVSHAPRVARDAADLQTASRGIDLGAGENVRELHERHGADRGGAVSSAERPPGRDGAAALSARKRVCTEPGWIGEPAGGAWATTKPVPCRRARTPARAKTANACRADIPRALGVRSSAGSASSPQARRPPRT